MSARTKRIIDDDLTGWRSAKTQDSFPDRKITFDQLCSHVSLFGALTYIEGTLGPLWPGASGHCEFLLKQKAAQDIPEAVLRVVLTGTVADELNTILRSTEWKHDSLIAISGRATGQGGFKITSHDPHRPAERGELIVNGQPLVRLTFADGDIELLNSGSEKPRKSPRRVSALVSYNAVPSSSQGLEETEDDLFLSQKGHEARLSVGAGMQKDALPYMRQHVQARRVTDASYGTSTGAVASVGPRSTSIGSYTNLQNPTVISSRDQKFTGFPSCSSTMFEDMSRNGPHVQGIQYCRPLEANASMKRVAVTGIVTGTPKFRMTNGGRQCMLNMILVDEQANSDRDGLQINMFAKNTTELPLTPIIGDVMLFQALKPQLWNGRLQCVNYADTHRWAWYSPETDKYITGPQTYLTNSDFVQMKKRLSQWKARVQSDNLGKNSVSGYAETTASTRPLLKLCEVTKDHLFFDFIGEVLKTMDGRFHLIILSDYTHNDKVYDRQPSKDAGWNGPKGRMSLQVNLWDEHCDIVDCCKVGDIIHLKNIRSKYNTAGYMEGMMHGDKRKASAELLTKMTILDMNNRLVQDLIVRKDEYYRARAQEDKLARQLDLPVSATEDLRKDIKCNPPTDLPKVTIDELNERIRRNQYGEYLVRVRMLKVLTCQSSRDIAKIINGYCRECKHFHLDHERFCSKCYDADGDRRELQYDFDLVLQDCYDKTITVRVHGSHAITLFDMILPLDLSGDSTTSDLLTYQARKLFGRLIFTEQEMGEELQNDQSSLFFETVIAAVYYEQGTMLELRHTHYNLD